MVVKCLFQTIVYVEKTYVEIRRKRLRLSTNPENALCNVEHNKVSEVRLMSSCHYSPGHQPSRVSPGGIMDYHSASPSLDRQAAQKEPSKIAAAMLDALN